MKKAIIIHPEGNTFNNPTLKCVVDLLRENNIDIVLRYNKSLASMPKMDGVGLFPYNRFEQKIRSLLFGDKPKKLFINIYYFFDSLRYAFGYDLIIGVDQKGLIESSAISSFINIPCVFFSFEIMFEAEVGKKIKEIERFFARNVRCWFVQDKVRQSCLIEENNLLKSNSTILPLASSGIGRFNDKRLRDDIEGIAIDKKVAIMIGSIADWTMAKDIINTLDLWPDEWVLLVHHRYGNTLKELLRLNINTSLLGNKLFISDYVSEMVDDLGYILNGVSVGFSLYKPNLKNIYTGLNLQNLGMSSGKISSLLRYGVPVIINEIGLYSELVIKYGLGAVVKNPSNISNELQNIKVNEDKYKKCAQDFFNK